MLRRLLMLGFLFAAAVPRLHAQLDPLNPPAAAVPNPLATPALTPGQLELYRLEAAFAADTARGGGRAFASWFAPDAVTLPNGKAPTEGQRAIARDAQWDPRIYQLTWKPDGARMGPSGDTGFTWGHFDAHSRDAQGQPVVRSGRYITVWKKIDGAWKVLLDASADDAPATDCCSLPKP